MSFQSSYVTPPASPSPSSPGPFCSPAQRFRKSLDAPRRPSRVLGLIRTERRNSIPVLPRLQAEKFASRTNLAADEISALYAFFQSLIGAESGSQEMLHKNVWVSLLSDIPPSFAARLFALFLPSSLSSVNFSTFIRTISGLLNASTLYERCSLCFQFLDGNESGFLEPEELEELVRMCVAASGSMNQQTAIHMTDQQIQDMVQRTFQECDLDGDGLISPSEFYGYARRQPQFIRRLCLDIAVVRAGIGLAVSDNLTRLSEPNSPFPQAARGTSTPAGKMKKRDFEKYIDSNVCQRKSNAFERFREFVQVGSESTSNPVSLVLPNPP
eukprot:GILK01005985.1.p1 GENE.GILK01005985.1~~GILK01005985.1.p1  ORF type:complete len:327 (+),score=44.62 GILK01005985.1:2-982(+)